MKIKLLLFSLLSLAMGGSSSAQGVRYDATVTQQGTIAGVTNAVLIPANPVIAFCNFPANAVPCTNKATTYSSITLTTPCATSTQIVLTGTTTCVASPDAQGNWGVWVPSGTYAYTITLPGGVNLGPYWVALGGAVGGTMDALTQGPSLFFKHGLVQGPTPLVYNGNFEDGFLTAPQVLTMPPPDWFVNPNFTCAYETVTQYEGSASLRCVSNTNINGAQFFSLYNYFPVIPGETYFIQAAVKSDGVVTARARIQFVDKNGIGLATGTDIFVGNATASWQLLSATGVAPANAVTAIISGYSFPLGTAGTTYFDAISVYRVSYPNINSTLYVTAPGADACAAINAQIALLPLVAGFRSGVVDVTALASASQPVACGTTVNAGSPYLWIRGPGQAALVFNCTVTAAAGCFNTQEGVSFVTTHGFRMSGFSVKGQGSANANAVGIHTGDMVGGFFDDIAVDGFTGANSSCIWADNINGFWEDNVLFRTWTGNINGVQVGCTKNLRFTNTAGTSNASSFAHNFILASTLTVTSGFTGISFESGSAPNSFWNLTGNVGDTASTTVLALSGLAYTAGPAAALDGEFFINVECTTCSTPGILKNIAAANSITMRAGEIKDSAGKLTDTGAGTFLYVGADPGSAAAAGLNVNSPVFLLRGRVSPTNTTDQFSSQIIYGAGANPTATLTVTHAGSSGLSQADWSNIANFGVNQLYVGGAPGASNIFQLGFNGGSAAGISGTLYCIQVSGVAFRQCLTTFGDMGLAGRLNLAGAPVGSAGNASFGSSGGIGQLNNNNGTTFPITQTIGNGTAAMTTAGIATGACGTTVTVAATGVLTTDTINFARNAAATIGNGGGLTLNAWPTAGNVNFNYCNSAAGTITPTAMTVNWSVVR